MVIFDIIVLVLFIWGAFQGLRDGVIVQLGGIAGLILGIYFAFRFGSAIGIAVSDWINVESDVANVVGFIIVLLGVFVGVGFLSRILSEAFGAMGLGILNKLGGGILAIVKVGLVLGVLLYSFDYLNRKAEWVEEETTEQSIFYRPMVDITTSLFPYIDFVKSRLMDGVDQMPESDGTMNVSQEELVEG